MSGDIFYTEVDRNLQKELQSRGIAGYRSRKNDDFKFMFEKVANVTVIPYEKSEYDDKDIIIEAVLGGATVRSGSFLPTGPQGYLTSTADASTGGARSYTISTTYVDATGEVKTDNIQKLNNSRRVPPHIRTTNITIADNSTGYLNDATVNIIIPNPDVDLEFIESVYFRPGRKVTIIAEHPNSAIASKTKQPTDPLKTDGYLNVDSELREKIKTLAKKNNSAPGGSAKDDVELKESYFKMNKVRFDGIIVSFEWKFQDETMTVDATITVRGTSNVYTDTNFIINQTKSTASTEEKDKSSNPNASNTSINTTNEADKINSFWTSLNNDITAKMPVGTNYYKDANKPQKMSIRDSTSQPITYITLYWLIESINQLILTKQDEESKNQLTAPSIKFDRTLCKSNYYEYLVSAFPQQLLLPDIENRTYGEHIYMKDIFAKLIGANESVFKMKVDGKDYYDPTTIMISMTVLQDMLNAEATKTVNDLLKYVSAKVMQCTGNAIELMLITPPVPDRLGDLLWYDKRAIPSITKETKIFSIPMGPNHPYGSIVHTLNMDAKLPSNVASLAYALNTDVTKLNESDIAPFISFMYTSNDVTRQGNVETRSQLITKNTEALNKLKASYKEKSETAKKSLDTAKSAVGQNVLDGSKQDALATQLKSYVTYPKTSMEKSMKIASPVIPIAVDFEIDGINGFRYGDIVTFDMLPSRYKNSVVWQIFSIAHEISEAGKWVTKIKCQMRAKIGS
jgi:hypothetical protein